MLITNQVVKIFYTTIPIINAVSDQTEKLVIKVLIRYIHDFQWFDVLYGIWIFHIFTSAKHEWKYEKILSHVWNKFHIQGQKQWIFCLLHFLWFLNMFLLNLRYCLQYTTWCHNSLLFSHCENILIFPHCEKNRLWRYHFN